MSKVSASNSNSTAAQLQAQEKAALEEIQKEQQQAEQAIAQLEKAAPTAKPQLNQIKQQVDQTFSLERSAVEAKFSKEIAAAPGATTKPAKPTTPKKPASTDGTAPTSKVTPLPKSSNAFINEIAPGAVASQAKYGVPASVTMAQAILESGWGKSSLASQDHNLFGIKGSGPAGSVTVPTREFENGHYVTINAAFRKYDNDGQSIDDHAKLLATNPAYKKAMADKGDPDKFADDLTGVYATDPNYGTSLKQIISQYNLKQYDNPKLSGSTGSTTPSKPAKPAKPSGTDPAPAKPTPAKTGGTYVVRSGDSMSAIASRNGVSLSALEQANPQIKNPNVIYPGEKLTLPGKGGSGTVSKPSGPSAPTSGSPAKGTNAASEAAQYLGKFETQLQAEGVTQAGVPTSESCANFVSAMLQKTGAIGFHTDLVSTLNTNLRNDGWKPVSLKDAKPGDVWICNGAGGESHTEIVASNKNGQITLIGSNNHPDKSNQQINYDSYSANINGSFILAPP